MRIAPAAFISAAVLTAACSGNPAPSAPAPQPAPAATAAPAPAMTATASTAVSAAPSAAAPAAASGAVDMSGAWTATIDVQGQSIAVDINLARGPNGYTGDAAPQGQSSAALSSLTVQGDRVTMTFAAPEGDATFTGTLSADRRTVTGSLSYQGQQIPFTMAKH